MIAGGGRVLLVEDDRAMCEMLEVGLRRRGFEVSWRTTAVEGFALLAEGDFDVVLTDLNLGGMSGLELCERVVSNRGDVPVVVFTAFGSLETAIAAIRAGAYDFVTKPVEIETLAVVLRRAVQHRGLRAEVKLLREVVTGSAAVGGLLGMSPVMVELRELIERVGAAEATVLITGESGTGKELVARSLHERSARRSAPFVAVNCAAVPEPLLESELFGHTKGAFTDARSQRSGLFQQAAGGTLFLDEIGDMPLALQPRLLRALQERRVRPVGADREVEIDVRIIAATNRDLETAVEEGRFREDLYFRINVIHIGAPPLRARGADVLLLAQHLVGRSAGRAAKAVTGISGATAEKLIAYSWPGNVRELQNCIERAVTLTRFAELTVEDLPEKIRNYRRSHVLVASDDPSELAPMEEVERRYVLRVLEAAGGNRTLAAKILGFDRKTLYRKLERYGLPPGQDPAG